jgi:hypothetical protein
MIKNKITLSEISESIGYCPKTGIFKWKKPTSNSISVGRLAGTKNNNGYVRLRFKKKYYSCHHLAWLFSSGNFPDSQIDHINGVRCDNRILNLRLCSPTENQFNRGAQKNNKLGHKNIFFLKKKNRFCVRIYKHKKLQYVRSFKTLNDAIMARNKKAKELCGEFFKV